VTQFENPAVSDTQRRGRGVGSFKQTPISNTDKQCYTTNDYEVKEHAKDCIKDHKDKSPFKK
jgi:hypothetical protein